MNATQLAHRALVTAVVLGVMAPRKKHLTVAVGELATIAGGADLLVVTDAAVVAEGDLAAAVARIQTHLGDGEAVALVVGSPVTAALSKQPAPAASRDDAYARAVTWAIASGRAGAPPLDPSRLGRIVDAMAEQGLILVEPEIGLVAPGLTRVRGLRSARSRALLATFALGARARPLLFVPAARAPKGGVARAKVERLADAWVSALAPLDLCSDDSDLVRAAAAVLQDATRTSRGPLPFKDLLREARDRWSAAARAAGGRATQSASDTLELASALYRLAAADRLELFALDPANPAWTLTLPPAR